MKIYRTIEGVKTELHDIEVDGNTELNQKISGQDLIRARFTSDGFMYDLQIGDYVEFKDAKYTILEEPQIKKSQNAFSYDIQFKSDQYLYNNVQLLNPGTEETEFYLFGDAIDMVSLVLNNMNRVYGQEGGTYFADFVEQTEGRNMRFNNINCLSALDQIAQEFGCEFLIKGYKLTFRKKIGKETGLTFRYKKELRGIERKTIQNGELVTVLYPFGSDRNITNEYGSKRLKIPKLQKNVDVFGTIERAKVFEDIYPRLKGVVSSASDYRTFTDTSIDFNINDQLMGGATAKVVFNTGDLAGREYEVERYDSTSNKITIIPYTDDSDFTTPDNTFKPRVGDKYVLVDIKMPQAYIDNAEEELLEAAQEYLDTYSQPNVIYTVQPHYPELRRQQINVELGDVVTLVDEDFGIEFETRILALTQKINNEFEYSLEIGNQVTLSYFSQVMGDQQEIRNDIYQNTQYFQELFNRVFNNVKGFSAPLYVNRGEFSASNYYYNNQNRRDYVFRIIKDGDQEYKAWYYYIGEDHQRAEFIEANWQLIGDSFEILATETLLAQNANIGNWLIQNGQIVSQAIYDSDDETEIEPVVQMNGNEGFIKFVTKKEVWNGFRMVSVKQTMFLDGRTGEISIDIGGLRSEFSFEGLIANTEVGQEILTPDGKIGFGGVVGNYNGNLANRAGITIPYLVYGQETFSAGVIGVANNSYTGPGGTAPAYGGAFWGLKSFGRYRGIQKIENAQNTFFCDEHSELISANNQVDCNLYLPKNPHEGREIIVRANYNRIDFRTEDGIKFLLDRNQVANLNTTQRDQRFTFTYDGQKWLTNIQRF